MSTLMLASVLALFTAVMAVDGWSELGFSCPLIFGLFAGLVIGDINLGFQVGATCTLMNLGFYNFGGATTPNYTVGAIFGVVAAKTTGDFNVGLLIATALGLLLMQLNILGRTINTYFLHAGIRALKNNNIKQFERYHVCGLIPWALADAIPVFIGIMLKDNLTVISDFSSKCQWFSNGLSIVGGALPAVGFALLLSYMDIKKYWPFMVVGYCLFAYMQVPVLGLALIGSAMGYLFAIKNAEGEKVG